MINRRVSLNSFMTDATSAARTSFPSGEPEIIPVFCVRYCVYQSLLFCVVLCRPLFVLLSVFFLSLYCLSTFDFRLLLTLLVSSNYSCKITNILSFLLPLLCTHSHLSKVFRNVKKSLYNQPKPYFFKKLLWSHFWININIFYTKTFGIVYILLVYLLIMFIWVVFICT